MIEKFAKDVDLGLSQEKKKLPSKYFYNKKGDELFIKIMNMDEYYLTRSEMEIFSEQAQGLIESFQQNKNTYFELIELGAGDGTKTKKLLSKLSDQGYQYKYHPVDISQNVLDQLEEAIKEELPNVAIETLQGDYFDILKSLKDSHHPKVVLFLGSNIGNMYDETAGNFLYQLGSNLKPGDSLLLGVDLIKPADIILPAYNDKDGITREFNFNLLDRINDELEASFETDHFEHVPEYNEHEGIAKSYLQSKRDQEVHIGALGKVYQFDAGEKIHTEISRKYNDDILSTLLAKTDFSINKKFTDSKGYFADYILRRS